MTIDGDAPPEIIAFADDRIETTGETSTCDREPLKIFPSAHRLLAVLARHVDHFVTDDEIAIALRGTPQGIRPGWLVWQIRQALGEFGLGGKTAIYTMASLGHMALSSLDRTQVAVPRSDEPVRHLGDGRVVLPMEHFGIVRVDGAWQPGFTRTQYTVLSTLAAAAPRHVTFDDLAGALGKRNDHDFRINMRRVVADIRRHLGGELGSPADGVIRSIEDVGFVALTRLSSAP